MTSKPIEVWKCFRSKQLYDTGIPVIDRIKSEQRENNHVSSGMYILDMMTVELRKAAFSCFSNDYKV